MSEPLFTTTHPNYSRETDMPKTWGDAGSLVLVGCVALIFGGLGVLFFLMALCVAWYAAAHERSRQRKVWTLIGMTILTGALFAGVVVALSAL